MQCIKEFLVSVEINRENRLGKYDKAPVGIDGTVDAGKKLLKLSMVFCFVPLRFYRSMGCNECNASIMLINNVRKRLPGSQYQKKKKHIFAPMCQDKCHEYEGKLPFLDSQIALGKHEFGFEPVEGEGVDVA